MSEKKKTFRGIAKDTNFSVQKVEEQATKDHTKTVDNFNHLYDDYKINTDKVTKIIVGTFTPKQGRERGVFYSSDKNPMCGYIDAALKSETKLQNSKAKLQKTPQNADIIKEILQHIVDNQIMFLDVIKRISDRDEESAADNDIKCFCLDKDSFEKYINRNIKFIPNSRNAEWALNKIFDELKAYKDKENTEGNYTPQFSRRVKREELHDRWEKVLK